MNKAEDKVRPIDAVMLGRNRFYSFAGISMGGVRDAEGAPKGRSGVSRTELREPRSSPTPSAARGHAQKVTYDPEIATFEIRI